MAPHFADLFEHAADAFPDRVALACENRQVTYQQLEARANRLAHYLAAAGVRPGEHVGLYASNSIEAAETILAACKIRAAAVNINYRYVEAELRYMLADCDPVVLVHDRRLTPRLAAVTGSAPGLRATVVIDDGSAAGRPGGPHDAGPEAPSPGIPYDEALAAGSPERDFAPRSADDVYVIYTGGTTGYPKGVMWRHEDIWRTLAGGIDFVTGVPLPDEWEQSRRGAAGAFVSLTAAPLIHGAAQVATLGGLFGGATMVLEPRFDPDRIWQAVQRHQVNTLVIIGDAMARPLIEAFQAGDYDASSLLAISSSAALFSPVVKQACARALPNVVITEAIGSSETGFAGLSFVSGDAPHRGGPTVRPGPDVIVLDDDGNRAPAGQVGRLARGGHVSLGYYKDPARTAAMLAIVDGRRYAVPGDLARIEDDGSITLLGRGNTCVNTGGEKVFPEEVEGALKSHDDVFDALVIGIPDERLGQRVAALVQPRPGRVLDLAALEQHVRGLIAGYKVPRSIWLVAETHRTVSGKADYERARRHAADRPADYPAAVPAARPAADDAGGRAAAAPAPVTGPAVPGSAAGDPAASGRPGPG
jgi:acyl-CoA synthetase (AMP-forming)/AMP-acid ligase II